MDRTKMAQKQMTLAKKAQADPNHRFHNLYTLMHWEYWIRCAADAVLARPGSATAGSDAQRGPGSRRTTRATARPWESAGNG